MTANTDTTVIRWADSNGAHLTLDDQVTELNVFFTDPPGYASAPLYLKITTGEQTPTINWEEKVLFPNGQAPTFAANETTVMQFYYDGQNYYQLDYQTGYASSALQQQVQETPLQWPNADSF